MITTELNLNDIIKLEFKECYYGNGICLEADIVDFSKDLGSLDNFANKLYFRVDTGPYKYGFPNSTGWSNPEPTIDRRFEPVKEEIQKPENYVCWRLPQHERRLWQAGFPVYFGFFNGEKTVEIELDKQITDTLKKDFD